MFNSGYQHACDECPKHKSVDQVALGFQYDRIMLMTEKLANIRGVLPDILNKLSHSFYMRGTGNIVQESCGACNILPTNRSVCRIGQKLWVTSEVSTAASGLYQQMFVKGKSELENMCKQTKLNNLITWIRLLRCPQKIILNYEPFQLIIIRCIIWFYAKHNLGQHMTIVRPLLLYLLDINGSEEEIDSMISNYESSICAFQVR